jgi:hypothetical protein
MKALLRTLLGLSLCATVGLAVGCDHGHGFEPLEVGGDSRPTTQPKSSSQFVRAVYADLLGRSPEVYDFQLEDADGNDLGAFEIDESEQLLGTLDSVADETVMRSIVTAGLCASKEVGLPAKDEVADPAAFIGDKFRRLLGREPTAYELAAFVGAWNEDPVVGPAVVVRAIIASREYQAQ